MANLLDSQGVRRGYRRGCPIFRRCVGSRTGSGRIDMTVCRGFNRWRRAWMPKLSFLAFGSE
jgi:hypothetical protein